MKRAVSIFAMVGLMAACNSKPEVVVAPAPAQPTSNMTAEDSLVLTQFRAWKADNELTDAREFLNGGQSTNNASSGTSTNRSSSSSSRSTGTRTVYNSSSSNTATAAKKKGWSGAAKGAVIGGVAGAAGGAVINKKNRAVGAVVGGILGAGVGYGIGRSKDVKSGRN